MNATVGLGADDPGESTGSRPGGAFRLLLGNRAVENRTERAIDSATQLSVSGQGGREESARGARSQFFQVLFRDVCSGACGEGLYESLS